MSESAERQQRQFKLLYWLYANRNADRARSGVELQEVAAGAGLTFEEAAMVGAYLSHEELVDETKWAITHQGIEEVEAALSRPVEATIHFIPGIAKAAGVNGGASAENAPLVKSENIGTATEDDVGAAAEQNASKRRSPRRPLVLRAEGDHGICAIENISEGGVFLQTDKELDVGQSIALTLSFPGLFDSIELTGVVVWRRRASEGVAPGVGVTFDGVPSRTRAVISNLLLDFERSDDNPGAEPLTSTKARPSLERAYRLLVVEDDVQWGLVYRRALDRLEAPDSGVPSAPLIVDFATNGWEGLKSMLERQYDLLLMDLSMAEMDGIRLLAQLRGDPKFQQTRIMVVSGAGPDALQQAMRLGADVAVGKPISVATIVGTVRALINAGYR